MLSNAWFSVAARTMVEPKKREEVSGQKPGRGWRKNGVLKGRRTSLAGGCEGGTQMPTGNLREKKTTRRTQGDGVVGGKGAPRGRDSNV